MAPRRIAARSLGAGAALVILAVAPAWAAPVPDTLNYDYFTAGCDTSSPVAEAFLFTRLDSPLSDDGDYDVNVGDLVRLSLMADGTDAPVNVADVETTFFVGDLPHIVTSDFVVPDTATVTLAEAPPYVVTTADPGQVLDFGVTLVDDGIVDPCAIPAELGTLTVYVNRAPDLDDDIGWTYWNTPISVPVLDNDDATWDSGTIDTGTVNLAAAQAVQDDLSQVPAALIGSNVGIATEAGHGNCVLESNGWITYTPDPGYSGSDLCTYSVTDNDGAYAEAHLQLEVIHPSEITSIEITATATEVAQGGGVQLTAIGTAGGFAVLGDVTADVTFASDVATDIVTGDTIAFPTASPHTITATHPGGATATIVIQVLPTLPATGASTGTWALATTLLLVLGAGLVMLGRARRGVPGSPPRGL